MIPVLIGLGALVVGGAVAVAVADGDNKKTKEIKSKTIERKARPEEIQEALKRKK